MFPVGERVVAVEALQIQVIAPTIHTVTLTDALASFRNTLSDDVGGLYHSDVRSVGGTGRYFRGEWHFPNAVPDEAQQLVVEATDEISGRKGTAELSLRGHS